MTKDPLLKRKGMQCNRAWGGDRDFVFNQANVSLRDPDSTIPGSAIPQSESSFFQQDVYITIIPVTLQWRHTTRNWTYEGGEPGGGRKKNYDIKPPVYHGRIFLTCPRQVNLTRYSCIGT